MQAVTTANFDFLRPHDPNAVRRGGLAERYFSDDPSTALIKLRQFAQLLAKLIADHHALHLNEREGIEDLLRRLSFEPIASGNAGNFLHTGFSLGRPSGTAANPSKFRRYFCLLISIKTEERTQLVSAAVS